MNQHGVQERRDALIEAIVSNALRPNNPDLLQRLAKVLGINEESHVLVWSDRADDDARMLETDLGCRVGVLEGEPQLLLFDAEQFDSAIIMVPICKHLHSVARELCRVLKPNGALGMVAFSVYREQMPDDHDCFSQVMPLLQTSRPAAAYRAVLAESGFTAFVSEDRRRDVRRTAVDNYRQHLFQKRQSTAVSPDDSVSQVLELMANGGIGVTLITAEKGR